MRKKELHFVYSQSVQTVILSKSLYFTCVLTPSFELQGFDNESSSAYLFRFLRC